MSNKVSLNQNNISFLNSLDSQLCIVTGIQDQITLSGDGTDSDFSVYVANNSADDSGIYFGSIFNVVKNLTKVTLTSTNDLTLEGAETDFITTSLFTITASNVVNLNSDTELLLDSTQYNLFNSPSVILQDGGTPTPESSALFAVNSTTKGFSISNLTKTERNAISGVPEGLMVYDTTYNDLFGYVTKASPVLDTWLGISKRYYISVTLTSDISSIVGPVGIRFGSNVSVVGVGMSYNTITSEVSFNMSSEGYFAFYANFYLTNIGGTQNGRFICVLYADDSLANNIERNTYFIIEGASSGQLAENNFAVVGRTIEQGVDFTNTVTVLSDIDNNYNVTFDTDGTWYGFTQI